MNSPSGADSHQKMGQDVPLPEQLSKECSPSSIVPEGSSLYTNLPQETGGLRKLKNAITDSLVGIAEVESGAKISDASRNILARFVDNSSRGFVSVVPMSCKGQQCPYINVCPLKAAGSKLPIGKRCPIEDTIAAIQISKHLQALNIENVDEPGHSFDMDMLCELAGLEVIRWRCGAKLAKNPDLIITQMVGATIEGEIIYQDVPNPVLDVLDKTSKHIGKLREALVATRKAQLEAGQDISDVSQRAAELRKKAESSRAKRLNQLKEAEYEIKNPT